MKFAPVNKQPQTSTVLGVKCERPGCGNVLSTTQKKYCSHTCRNLVLSPGNSGGAVSKYKHEYSTTTFEKYLSKCEEGHKPTLIPTKKGSYITLQNAKLPSIDGYSDFIGFSNETLRNWAAEHPEFAKTLDKLKSIQKTYLINMGLSGRYNSNIAKLLLGVNHGMVERKKGDSKYEMMGIVKLFYDEVDRKEKEMRENKKEEDRKSGSLML